MSNCLRMLQKSELSILVAFADICERYSLTYYLAYGTLLGAKRHNGFIPWDDDVDVAMPRRDYELFCKEFYKYLPSNFRFKSYKIDSKYNSYVPRIENNDVIMIDKFDMEYPAWIDIFPIDGVPKPKTIEYSIHRIRLFMARYAMNLARLASGTDFNIDTRSAFENCFIRCCKFLRVGLFFKSTRQFEIMDRLLLKYKSEDTLRCVNFLGEKFKDECDLSLYGNCRRMVFEGVSFQVPQDSEKMLTLLYGDYMKLPPENQRNVHSLKSVRLNNTNE